MTFYGRIRLRNTVIYSMVQTASRVKPVNFGQNFSTKNASPILAQLLLILCCLIIKRSHIHSFLLAISTKVILSTVYNIPGFYCTVR